MTELASSESGFQTDPLRFLQTNWASRYRDIRQWTASLLEPLTPEDCVIQSMADVSPTKWHVAHTTWFFETFVLSGFVKDYKAYHPNYNYLFNSYYNAVGARHARPQRGLLSRPPLKDVLAYRRSVDEQMMDLLHSAPDHQLIAIAPIVELGLHHEQQHQELLITDIKHVFWCNPLRPAYRSQTVKNADHPPPMQWIDFEGGLQRIGMDDDQFCFDNERPRHHVYLNDYQLGDRLVTNGEFLEFVQAGGYQDPQWWLSDAWDVVKREGWQAPLYWQKVEGHWQEFTLEGQASLQLAAPVCHVSFYEADAYARWAGARLATEQEWEHAASLFEQNELLVPPPNHFLESHAFHPVVDQGPTDSVDRPRQCFGVLWQWTASGYAPYPGFQPLPGALGEYNGKFMCNQFVLRGSSCATPREHGRLSYRNFFAPHCRWQMMGIRLAK